MTTPPGPPCPRRRGFTLLELILLLALVSIVAAVAIPLHFGRPEVTLIEAGELFVRDVDAARRIAVISGLPVELHLEPDGYVLTTEAGDRLTHPRTGAEFHRDYDRDAVFRGVEVLGAEADPDLSIRFEPLGGASGADRVELAFGDQRIVIRVDPLDATAAIELGSP